MTALLLPVRFLGQNRVVGESQGFMGLPIREGREIVEILVNHLPEKWEARTLQSFWLPSPEALGLLNAGHAIRLTVITEGLQPPVRLEVDPLETIFK